jgi:CheY-like chemotaxis protein
VCHVLIIEDEFLIALDLQDLLEAHGADTFAFAATEAGAIKAAKEQKPDFITSDVVLAKGTGPRAVEVILQEIGPVPVIFITGTPEACDPCPPPARILGKPLSYPAIISAFLEMAPVSL